MPCLVPKTLSVWPSRTHRERAQSSLHDPQSLNRAALKSPSPKKMPRKVQRRQVTTQTDKNFGTRASRALGVVNLQQRPRGSPSLINRACLPNVARWRKAREGEGEGVRPPPGTSCDIALPRPQYRSEILLVSSRIATRVRLNSSQRAARYQSKHQFLQSDIPPEVIRAHEFGNEEGGLLMPRRIGRRPTRQIILRVIRSTPKPSIPSIQSTRRPPDRPA